MNYFYASAIIFGGLILIIVCFLQYGREFKCHWKEYFLKLNLPAIISLIFSTIFFISLIILFAISNIIGIKMALFIMIIVGLTDGAIFALIKIFFLIVDRIYYNRLLNDYISRTYNIESKRWEPEDPLEPQDMNFEFNHIQRKIKKLKSKNKQLED